MIVLVLHGPAETISGKYPRHSKEYRALRPPPAAPSGPLPADVEGLCRRIEAGDPSAEAFAALGEALLKEGRPALAYRAFHRAHRLRPQDAVWGRRMMERKRASERVPDPVIAREEREAEAWVRKLQAFERARIAAGKDPDDRTEFYEHYGRPSDDMARHLRARRLSFVGGVVGFLVGAAFLFAGRKLPRKAALLPLAVAALCALGPQAVGQTGLFWWGAGFAAVGAAFVFRAGRPA